MNVRAAAWIIAGLLASAAGGALSVAESPSAFAQDPAPADPIAEARVLSEAAKEFERTAGDGDADNADRRTARKQAYDRLYKAIALMDGWLDKHPADEEKYEAFYCDLKSRIFWIKKMAAVDEFTEHGPGPGASPSPAPAPTPDKSKPTVEAPAPPTAAQALAEIEAYAGKHKGDVPGAYERYQEFLSKYPDPSTPEYAKAMAEVATLGTRLKDVYRLIHDDDPDSVKNVDGAQTEKLVGQLLEDLDKGSSPVKERAARFLGALGSGKAADPLMKTLKKEKSGPVYDACADALAKIGGRRVCERLAKSGKDEDLRPAVVDILMKILRRGGAEGRLAGEALGGYVANVDPERRGPIFESLAEAGPTGALGLARGIEHAPPEDMVKLIEKLPDAGDPRVVTYLAKFLVTNAPGDRAEFASASRKAITKIGKPGVRYLIPHLDDPAVSVWTAEMLQRITGQKLKDDKRKTWEAWFRKNRKALEGK